MNDFFKRYLLPGFVFEAAVIGGGYATGRELVEFFLPAGPWGGLLGMMVSMLVWSAVLMVSLELARRAGAYDYRSFFKLLLGRGWVLFEIAYFLLMVIVLAVMGAAAGEITHSLFGGPKLAGSLAMIAATGLMLAYSSSAIEKFLALSVSYLYLVYIIFVVWSVVSFGDRIEASFAAVPVGNQWFKAGITYAGYNVATIPAVLFCIRHLSTRREAFVAGLLAGPLGMLPGVVFYIAMMGYYDEIGAVALPSAFLLAKLEAPWFEWAFQIAVLLTLVDTGVAMLHAINERVAKVYQERGRPMPRILRPALSVAVMVISVYAASAIGLVQLIAKGYGMLTYAFIVLLILPVLTVGIWKIRKPAAALGLAAFCFCMSCSLHQTRTADSAPRLKNPGLDVAELDALIAHHVGENDLIGLSVGVMQEGKIVLAKGYGLASLETRAPVTRDTMFAIASVSKQFTCAALMLLAEDGKLSLDDRVAEYDKTLTRAGDITLLDLGQHVAGYADYYPLDFVDRRIAEARPVDEVVRDYAKRPLDFEPRTRFSYSNTGYLFIGRVIERVSGEDLERFLERRIFEPLGLRNTDYELRRDDPRVARGYASFGLGAPEPAVPEGEGWIAAAGGVWSTPGDLLSWDLALMDGKVLSPRSYSAMTTPRRLPDGRSTGYGCGQSVADNGPALVLSHGGATSGFRASNTFVPATRSGVVLMANRDFAVLDPLREAILRKLLPLGDVPAIQGLSAAEAAGVFLRDLRERKVDRSNLGEEYNVYLTDERIAEASRTLAREEPAQFEPPVLSERGGMEVSRTRFKLGKQTMQALMYRTRDGKIQQFLFFRQ